jgi:hypothetical protein
MNGKTLNQANKFFDRNPIEIYTILDEEGDRTIPTNVKVELTGIKKYISMGEWRPHVTFTAHILPTNEESDIFYSVLSGYHGKEQEIQTFDHTPYGIFVWVIQKKLSEMLEYFSLPDAMLTKVVNEVPPLKLKEGTMNKKLLNEDKYDSVVRQLVRDIITIYKKGRDGEFGLPEDLYENKVEYNFPQFDSTFSIYLEISTDESVDGFDVEAAYYRDEDMISVEIVTNPSYGPQIIQELVGELNEVLRHELEHLKQYEKGYKFPKKEPTNPEKYYSQSHELDAQKAGFKRRSKGEKINYETLVRRWFQDNRHKHRMTDDQAERVIQKILKEK